MSVIRYYEGINKVSIEALKEWFENFINENDFYLMCEPKILVSGSAREIRYTIQIAINDSLKPYIMLCKNKTCIDKYYIPKDYSNIDKIFINLLVMLKKSIKI